MMGLDRILDICVERGPTTEEIEAFAQSSGVEVEAALNTIALQLARRYDAGAMNFEDCDRAANFLHGWSLLKRERSLPELAYQVFLAFDEGEYRHQGDADHVDPEAKYSRPMIKALLRAIDAA